MAIDIIKAVLAARPALGLAITRALAGGDDPYVRQMAGVIASYMGTGGVEVLALLAGDSDPMVRRSAALAAYVAYHLGSPASRPLLEQLAEDADPSVSETAQECLGLD